MRKSIILMLLFVSINLFCDLNFGKDLFDDGLYEEAIQEFEKVIAGEPTGDAAARALFYIGECYSATEEYDRAESSYKRLLSGYPSYSSKDKAFYRLAVSQFEQAKYRTALSGFESVIERYPLSQFSEFSLEYIVRCCFESEDYSDLIVKGRKLVKDYEKSNYVPDVMFWMAQAYFKVNIPEEGNALLKRINTEFTSSNANWKAVEFTTGLLEKAGKTEEAIVLLKEKTQENIPRQYEEKLKNKLAEFYMKISDYESANNEFDEMISKFGNSDNIDFYITKQALCLLELGHFSRIISEADSYKKVLAESDFKDDYELFIATAYLHLNDFENSENKIADILQSNEKNVVFWKAKMLSAEISEASGKISKAGNIYREVLNSDYPDKQEILFALGNISYEKLHDALSAKNYFRQILTNYSDITIRAEAAYKISLCYEEMGQTENAIEELQQINLKMLADTKLKSSIETRLRFLTKFKHKNYEAGFYKLLNSLYDYAEDDDKQGFQEEMIKIVADDLKDLDKGLSLLQDNPKLKHLEAKILLRIADKYNYEADNENKENYIFKANSIITKLPDSNTKTELMIFKNIVESDEISEGLISSIKEFVTADASAEMRNELILIVTDYYSDSPEEAAEYLEMLMLDANIDEKDFVTSKLKLAEYYYNKDENEKALSAYQLVHSQINLTTPSELFHYAVILNETGNQKTSIDKFTLLLNNAEHFAGFTDAVNYFAKLLRDDSKHKEALQYSILIPQEQRDDFFYLTLADDYLILGNKEKAKETLMYIQEKNDETLSNLAMLQFETNDLEMSEYTYKELSKRNPKDRDIYRMLGRINFVQENFLDAAKYYKNIVDALGENFTGEKHIGQIAKENIISLYRIENRPKAQTLTKKFKTVLSLEDKNEIKLNEGIYYIEIDKKKAEGVFTKLLKDTALKNDTKIATYFWRGVCRLEMKKSDEAEADFETVANSIDETFSNQAHLKLGTLNFSNEKYDKSLEHYYKVIENDKDGKLAFDAARNFAFVCKTIEEWQKAVSAYEIILERWGDEELESSTMFDIAFCHYRDKKYKNAIEMFRKALSILETKELKAEAQYWIADSYFGLDEYEKSISEYLKVSYAYPEFPHWAASAELRAGEAYINLKDNEKARRTFERIIEKYGRSSNWGKEALKRLETVN